MKGQKNVIQPSIPLMGFFDESFWVRVPWGGAGHRLYEARANFTPVSLPCQAGPSKFTWVILNESKDLASCRVDRSKFFPQPRP
jgi:hypothetical protein